MPFALEQLSQALSLAAVVSPQTLNGASANSGRPQGERTSGGCGIRTCAGGSRPGL
jgi:hypothetical protein